MAGGKIIRDSLFESEKMAGLSDFEFRVWISLLLLADDAGRGDARPAIIKGRAFPLRERVTLKEIDAAVHGLAAKDIINILEPEGKPIFKIVGWEKEYPELGRKTKEYKEWRKAVFRRDNYTCQMCGKRGGKLVAHHKKRYRNAISERTVLENGITLCEDCHKLIHHLEGK